MTEVDQAPAASLGWPKSKYAWVERERRWPCDGVPLNLVTGAERYVDLYVTGTQLRLRKASPLDGSEEKLRLGRKADVSAAVRLLTSIYLSPREYELLASLPGKTIEKTRHSLGKTDGADMFVDVFDGPLHGLVMAEAEFESSEAMAAFTPPDFVGAEVTDDARYTGGRLVTDGLPMEADPT